jgi:hypothetical protein
MVAASSGAPGGDIDLSGNEHEAPYSPARISRPLRRSSSPKTGRRAHLRSWTQHRAHDLGMVGTTAVSARRPATQVPACFTEAEIAEVRAWARSQAVPYGEGQRARLVLPAA